MGGRKRGRMSILRNAREAWSESENEKFYCTTHEKLSNTLSEF